ncbi:restriction endonuclease subunit S [Methanohalophilus portucalensis]|uniref:Type I restriction enzyme, S subunit n=2 Tax=Methanohalophilus portucalensis TaxID=39664 RepID=A0A1X7P0A3_9EURY|nr:restriction endonuclease subunit S [Methanohalophilus portucalensis]ATU08118.1 hypothetical protein BKM01_04615 [Methanohalophilus portucalensis]RNI10095.1 hypothetical protein EFE41_08585 [Methanohalophilus portucalensis FDF-1]SMH44159.1 type I restriction enzyme, S subunit [Methanohalophilus portucalensis FDF-1]
MKTETFFEILPHLSESPNGVQKLREMILQMAIQGKIVPQNPDEEPAEILLTKIEVEKEKRSKKPLEIIAEEEIPFKIPKSWKFLKLKDVCEIIRGITYKKSESSEQTLPGYLPLLRANNINGTINFDKLVYIPKEKIKPPQFVKAWDIVIAMSSGSINLVGKAAQAKKDLDCTFGAFCGVVRPSPIIYRKYINYYFHSPNYRNTVQNFGKGIGINNLSKKKLESLIIPIPPLAEQHRIVAKVDQLMNLCDELERKQQKRSEVHIRMNNGSLSKLQQPDNEADFNRIWAHIRDNFDLLYTKQETVKKLREAVLQLAVQGRLVEQDPNDEPAAVLLDRIAEEKKRLQKEGKLKRQKELPPIEEDEVPYEMPSGWEWVRLGTLVSLLGDGLHGTPEYTDDGNYYFINGNNLYDGEIIIKNNNKKVSYDEYIKYKKPLNDRTVFVSINGTLGNVAFYNGERVILGKSACYFNLLKDINKEYIKKVINTRYFLDYCYEKATGSTIKNVSLKNMRLFLVPLPPLNEQQRIVEKVDILMELCDRLEANIKHSEEVAWSFAEVVGKAGE